MTQPTQGPTDPLKRIFAYRAIDLRDHFPQPLETFREALECLQSERSYMAAMSGEIIAYLRGGYSVTIPNEFFIYKSSEIDAVLVSPEENDAVCEKVDAWLRATLEVYGKDLPKTVPLEDRPYSLYLLLQQCDLQAPELDEVKEWQEAPDVGRECLDSPSEIDVWQAAERLLENREGAKRWMTSPKKVFRGRTPAEVAVEDPQRAYDLIMRLEHGIFP
ncbi:antitoxin Xre/MbcA/ParS toxin-binding domain-containing protein [Halomonas saccharevitans]|uniref:Antitoxin Xre/MbcA/ParS toxin-binding domain-containing protein n=1 Tax=Halomonas saccharevitans TaxID=416872 RepID=A0ABU3NDS5_9GAMM|nr:antitoxin Xre/MbcA/ParS toxin-binding domain-containing protein [Halomonas saccharevitans]MDT8878362.1 antitoxin Xre/MbcA/ParS toxin-binding domain-containing protein [Halomonas saccharevitans]